MGKEKNNFYRDIRREVEAREGYQEGIGFGVEAPDPHHNNKNRKPKNKHKRRIVTISVGELDFGLSSHSLYNYSKVVGGTRNGSEFVQMSQKDGLGPLRVINPTGQKIELDEPDPDPEVETLSNQEVQRRISERINYQNKVLKKA